MKFLILILFLPLFSYSQLSDTTCIQSRWIACQANEDNRPLFPFDKDSIAKFDIVHLVKELVEDHKMKIYSRNQWSKTRQEWNYIDYDSEVELRKKDSLIWNNDPYFEISVQSDIPLTDEYGDPLTKVQPDGFMEYVYPPAEVYVFSTILCDEIRIKEERYINELTNEVEFRPVGLSFYFKSLYGRGKERFWIDLDEFFSVLEEKESFAWYWFIVEKKYKGFQYMQTSCYDKEIRN